MTTISWTDATWSREPAALAIEGDTLTVTAAEGSDHWSRTAYGFVHDDSHALLAPLAVGQAMEVAFSAAFDQEFDQAGVFIHVDNAVWTKAGVEFADGHLGVGAVVTDTFSDWSVGRCDDWRGRAVTVRVSRWPDALIIRARADDEPWRLIRVAPFSGSHAAQAGPFIAAPTRAGLSVSFTSWVTGDADTAIH